MRILHIVRTLDPASGGPARSVAGLCKALAAAGEDVSLLVHSPVNAQLADVGGCKLMPGQGDDFESIRPDFLKAVDACRPELVHFHGIWLWQLHIGMALCRKLGLPYIIAPRGMLEPWPLRQKRLKKRLAMWLYQRKDLKRAVALHGTAKSEVDQFHRLGFSQKTIISPNGVNFPEGLPPCTRQGDGCRRVLFLSRIHPKKGLLELVRAWAFLRAQGWVLEIVGNDSEGYWRTVADEIGKLGIGDSIIYSGCMDDKEKWKAYRRADFFVLPTHSENFGIVIAEALYAGLPVITTRGAPWKDLITEKCGMWIDDDQNALIEAMKSMMAWTDETRKTAGERGHHLVLREYSWPAIAKRMSMAYNEILCG